MKISLTTLKIYQDRLQNSGHNTKLKFEKENKQKKRRNSRNRNVIYYNPPSNISLKTNLGKTSLKLIDKYFPKNHKLYKIIDQKKR